ncbi:hypothetical protein [Gayadomonas joobiniege]|uniref:hypothetical protein n=1 Tax=Gayadomonas joobiniege TaxID=1234606 RepID=UPI00037FAE4E|nr:hypothetical protein [Gayadomonas joobiniege]
MSIMQMLARCGVKTVKFDTGRGGVPKLVPEDIIMQIGMAQASGRISANAADYALAYYCNLSGDKNRTAIQLLLGSRVYIKSRLAKMRMSEQTSLKIASLALEQSTQSNTCPKCNGTKKVIVVLTEFNRNTAQFNHRENHSEVQECKACDGTGYLKVSDYKKAKYCDMSGSKSWTENHEKLLFFAQSMISDWNKQVADVLHQLNQENEDQKHEF